MQEVPIQQVAPAADTKLAEIQRHLEEINIDFKENIMRKVEMLKLKDTDDLQRRVDAVKREESLAVQRLNKECMQREEREGLVLEKHKAKKQLLMRIVAQWEGNKRKRALFQAWKLRTQAKAREYHQGDYCHAFFLQGLKQRGFKAFKLYAQVAGNRMYERRVKERINIDIRTRVEERQNEKEFLVAMIRELEEQLRIELRKKTILKAQCDQAYLRGVSAISMEALKMSQSTLKDYYSGMKMTTFDGNNIYSQIRKMNEEPAAFNARGGFNQSFGNK